ncbi:DinB family protein [Flaviaesturariibacter terrae]
MPSSYLESVTKQFEYYKLLGEKTFAQLRDEDLFWRPNEESNSIAAIVKHLWGNMLSRWTDFLDSDGEKEWRDREGEFASEPTDAADLRARWDAGWSLLLQTLRSLTDEDLDRIVYIRNQGHTVLEAINRQLAHYPYHVGQIVYIGKMRAQHWSSLSIPRGASQAYNADKFAQPKERAHFTDEVLGKQKK